MVSHNALALPSTPVETALAIPLLAAGADVVGIDEAQFFDASLADACTQLANSGVRVLVAGLDLDYRGGPLAPCPPCWPWPNM